MNPDIAVKELKALAELDDHEIAHDLADKLLLAMIADPRIRRAYNRIKKYYA